MKFKVRFNRRHNMYITLFACAVGLILLVTRFGLTLEQLGTYALITLGMLLVLVGIAALLGFLLNRRHQDK